MTKNRLTMIAISAMIGLTGCNNAPTPMKYNINRDKSIEHIERSFELSKKYKSHKAMAVALDNEGKYVLGYSFDCASEQSAKSIALHNCTNANANAEVKADAPCTIFALENTIVKPFH